MTEEIGFENGRFFNFKGSLTLTLDWVIRYTIVQHSSISTIPRYQISSKSDDKKFWLILARYRSQETRKVARISKICPEEFGIPSSFRINNQFPIINKHKNLRSIVIGTIKWLSFHISFMKHWMIIHRFKNFYDIWQKFQNLMPYRQNF